MPLAGSLVHVIDSDAAVRGSLAVLLHSHGAICDEYESGESFLAGAARYASGFILVNWELPGMGAAALIEAARQINPLWKMIVVTARDNSATIVQIRLSKPDAILLSPYDQWALFAAFRAASDVEMPGRPEKAPLEH